MNKKILFIDNDNNFLQSIKRNIKIKYRDVIADFEDNPEEIIKKIDKMDYNIIVTDYRMPGLDGGTFLKKIKEKHPDIISIILTGFLDDALKSDIDDPKVFFLEKPYSIDDLMQTIELALIAEHQA